MTFRLKVGPEAEEDIEHILEWSVFRFGADVRDGYQALIRATLTSIARDPGLPGSHEREDLGRSVQIVHLRTCRDEVKPGARRIAKPRHLVIYRCEGTVVQVVRLLHDAMDISSQIIPK